MAEPALLLPRGVIPPCTKVIDKETGEMCEDETVYQFRFKGWDPGVRGTACARHGQEVRGRDELEWIRSA